MQLKRLPFAPMLSAALALFAGFAALQSSHAPDGPSLDGGTPTNTTLPDGGAWFVAADGGFLIISTPPAVIGNVIVATPNGYAVVSYTMLPDGGYTLGTPTQNFDYRCADNTGTCLFLDGGLVPVTGSYPSSTVTGAGCLPRPSVEVAGFTGAPAGCNP